MNVVNGDISNICFFKIGSIAVVNHDRSFVSDEFSEQAKKTDWRPWSVPPLTLYGE